MEQRPFPAYKGDGPYIFVSYAHADSGAVYPLLSALRDRGVNIWYDEGIEPGSKWREELSSAIQNAEKVLFIASKRSVASANCERELDYALSLNIPVRLAYIEKVLLPPALSFSLGSHQAIFSDHYDEETFRQKVHDAIVGNPVQRLGRIASRNSRMLAVGAGAAVFIAAAALFFSVKTGMRDPGVERADIEITPTIEEPVRVAIRPLQNVTGETDLDWLAMVSLTCCAISFLHRVTPLFYRLSVGLIWRTALRPIRNCQKRRRPPG